MRVGSLVWGFARVTPNKSIEMYKVVLTIHSLHYRRLRATGLSIVAAVFALVRPCVTPKYRGQTFFFACDSFQLSSAMYGTGFDPRQVATQSCGLDSCKVDTRACNSVDLVSRLIAGELTSFNS